VETLNSADALIQKHQGGFPVLRTQVSTSKGASVKSSLVSPDCRGLKLSTQVISATSF